MRHVLEQAVRPAVFPAFLAGRYHEDGRREGIRTPDLSLRRGWDEITKARLCRFFLGEVNRVKRRKAQLEAAKRGQTRHGAGFIRTPKH